jgi:hypothetical protein
LAWIPLFQLLKENTLGDYMHSFVEGLSGGMYAGKIAGLNIDKKETKKKISKKKKKKYKKKGTFIPRLHAFGFRAQVSLLFYDLFFFKPNE